jgi:hypothetical protein
VHCAAATWARVGGNVDYDLVTRQMIRQRLAPRRRIEGLRFNWRKAHFDAADIAVEVLEAERELVGIEPLRAPAELHPLQLLDDRLKPFDFTVAMLDGGGHVAHQAVQHADVGGQIVEIEPHARFYFCSRRRPSVFPLIRLVFGAVSADFRRPPDAHRRAPVNALDQHRELRRRERHCAARLVYPRPDEPTLIDALGEQAEPVPIPEQHLQHRRPLTPEGEKMTRERVLPQLLLNQGGEPVHALSHVGVAECQVHLHV